MLCHGLEIKFVHFGLFKIFGKGNPFAYGLLLQANPQLPITATLPAGAVVAVPIVLASDDSVVAQELPPWLS